MENTTKKKSKSLKCGFLIKPLSIISLVCIVLTCIIDFIDFPNAPRDYEISFRLPYLTDIISLTLILAPVVLFVLYIFNFYSKLKATILIPIIFGTMCLNIFFYYLCGNGYYGYFILWIIYIAIDLAKVICLILAVISALKGLNKKAPIILSMSFCLLNTILSFMEMFKYIQYYLESPPNQLYALASLIVNVGKISFFIALLLFCLNNKIPSILSIHKEKTKIQKADPEEALKVLTTKLDLDMITEEEYQLQRAEIISKL